MRGRAALHPGPAARRAAVQGPPRRAEDARCRSGWCYDPAGRVVLDPDAGVRDAVAPPVRRVRTAPGRPARWSRPSPTTGCCSRPGSAPAPTRVSWSGCRCGTGGCCASCTTPATPARSSTAGAAEPVTRPPARPTIDHRAPRAMDRADPRRPPRLHQPGTSTRPTRRRCWPTPTPTAPTRQPGPPGKAPPCCKAWRSAAAAGDG